MPSHQDTTGSGPDYEHQQDRGATWHILSIPALILIAVLLEYL
jgi:hypothetical protein